MRTSTSTTPTFITEVSCYFTKAVLNDCYSEVMAYTALVLTLIGLVSTTRMNAYMSRPLSIPTTAAIIVWVYIAPHHATSY